VLLDAVVQITLDPPPGVIRRGDDPRPGGHQLGATLRVGDRRRDQLGERDQARLGVRRQRLLMLRLRREAPCCIPGLAGRNSKGGSWV